MSKIKIIEFCGRYIGIVQACIKGTEYVFRTDSCSSESELREKVNQFIVKENCAQQLSLI